MIPGIVAQQVGAVTQPIAFPTSGLTSYWRLDETSGSTAADRQGVNNAAIDGSPTWSTDSKLGGRCLDFATGTSPRMRANAALSSSNECSIGIWVKRNGSFDNRIIASRQRWTGTSNDQYYWYLTHRTDRNGLCLQYDNRSAAQTGAAQYLQTNDSLAIGAYSLVGLTYKPATNTAQILINGVVEAEAVLVSPGSGQPSFDATAAELMFGNRISNYSSIPWDGKLDEPFLFNRVLTQDEWDDIYNGGAGIQY